MDFNLRRLRCLREQSVSLAGFLLMLASVGHSQDAKVDRDTVYNVSPVIVTATTAQERVSPVTFSNLSRAEIRERYSAQDIPVLLSELPSITTYSENGSGIGYNYINLRGFDQRRISVMINGVPQNDPEDHNVYWIDFPDLLASTQGIQVQRGAGSAFYGPAAIGGSVNLVANPFENTPSVTLDLMAGFQELSGSGTLPLATKRVSLAVNSGLMGGTYMLHGRVGTIRHDGYREIGWTNMTSYFLGAIRIDPTMTTRVHMFGGPIRDGLAYVGLPKEYNADLKLRRVNYSYWEYDSTGRNVGYAVAQKPQATEWFSQPHFEVLHDWKLSSSSTLHTTLFNVIGQGYFDYDGDWLPYDNSAARWFRNNLGYPPTFGPASSVYYSFLVRGSVKNRQWGLLPVLEVEHVNGTLTVGGELRFHRSLHQGFLQEASVYPTPQFGPNTPIYEYRGRRDIMSLYVHELYHASETVTLLGEAQLAYNRYGIGQEWFVGTSFDVKYLFVNPRVGVNVNMSDEWNVYGFAGLTSREPRMRNLYAAEDAFFGATPQFVADTSGGVVRYDLTKPLAKPERLVDIEFGSIWRNDRWRLAVNAYWMEFQDELVKSGQVDVFGQPVTGNAERSRHLGIELDGAVRVNDIVTVSGNTTLSRNRLVRYRTYEGGSLEVLDGNPIAGFPAFLANLRCSADLGKFSGAVVMKHVGTFATDNSGLPGHENDAYTVLNLEGAYAFRPTIAMGITVKGEVRNMFDLLYTMNGEGEAFFPAAERNYVVGVSLQW